MNLIQPCAQCSCLAVCALLLTNCAGEDSQTPNNEPVFRFSTLVGEAAINLTTTSGTQPATQILEVNGGGLGLIDFDNDGDLDLFVANGATLSDPENGPGSRLYENLGGLRFKDVTGAAGIHLTRWAMGVAVGDYDGDGRDDLYVTCYGPNVLLRNEGEGRFTDVTKHAGVGDPRWGTSCAFGDIDNDGDLDLYVVNYLQFDAANPPGRSHFKGIEVMAGPHGLPAQHDILYENLGDGTFRDITAAANCLPAQPGYGLGVIIIDFDADGRQDIFVGNDSMTNFLFHNLGEKRFEERGVLSGIAANIDGGEQATMGIAVADVDANGYPDLFTTNFSSDTNTLHLNLDGAFFDDRTQQFGLALISRPFLGWSCGFFDFDLDGDEDLLMFNSHVYPQATMDAMDSDYEQTPLLFEREGKRFARRTEPQIGSFLDERHRDRAAVFGDFDHDGDIDVIVSELNGPIRVLRNDHPGGNWLTIELRDERETSRNHRGLGSRIELTYPNGGQRRWIYTGGYQTSIAPYAHFGLPADVLDVAAVIVWPDGYTQRIESLPTKARHLIRRP
ncbi:MAG: CRTAC1 family protein [Planctomycetes bacterium]|nr:CRTAC1 family protein [Planctomycetota bacterium]